MNLSPTQPANPVLADEARAAAPEDRVTRYHALLVTLHWVLAPFIIAALALGALKMAPLSNASPLKYEALKAHMTGGILILILMSARFAVRALTLHPAEATTGVPVLNTLARVSHRLFYALVSAMAVSGLLMAFQTGVIGIVAGGHPPIPIDFWTFPIRSVHYLISRALMLLILLHLAGVGYHTFIKRDHLLRRMAFKRRSQPIQTTTATELTSLSLTSLWVTRTVLVLGTLLFAMIGRKYIFDPVGAAQGVGIQLATPMALTAMRASFGAFPLACAAVTLACLISRSRHRVGLWFIAMLMGVVLVVRFYGVATDGTLEANHRLLIAEGVMLCFTVVALLLGRHRGSRVAEQ